MIAGLTLERPVMLLLLAVPVALGVWYVLLQRRRPRYEVRVSDLSLLSQVLPDRPGPRRHVPALLLLASLLVLTVGLAEPTARVPTPRAEATIVVAIDVSGSMQATDVPPDRLAAAKLAAARFVDSLPDTFEVSLVSFSDSVSVVVAPTEDHEVVVAAIGKLAYGGGTAIGDALHASLNAAGVPDPALPAPAPVPAPSSAPSSPERAPVRIVLLSDGANTHGRAVEIPALRAKQFDAQVSTIAFGTRNGTVLYEGVQVPVPADREALARIAETTGGESYAAGSAKQLREAYAAIGQDVGSKLVRRDVTFVLLGVGLALLVLSSIASLTLMRALP